MPLHRCAWASPNHRRDQTHTDARTPTHLCKGNGKCLAPIDIVWRGLSFRVATFVVACSAHSVALGGFKGIAEVGSAPRPCVHITLTRQGHTTVCCGTARRVTRAHRMRRIWPPRPWSWDTREVGPCLQLSRLAPTPPAPVNRQQQRHYLPPPPGVAGHVCAGAGGGQRGMPRTPAALFSQ